MTDRTQPEALRLADWLQAAVQIYPQQSEDEPGGYASEVDQIMDDAAAELRRQHARIAELEAQLEAIGAGGVSGPLMGQPQAMPDLSALTERGAKAWAGVDAQGLRDGAASAGSEPVGWPKNAAEVREFFRSDFIRAEYVADDHRPCDEDRYYISAHDFLSAINWWADFPHHPSPPEGMVGGWQSIATAPKDSGYLLLRGGREQDVASGYWLQAAYAGNGAWIWPFVHMTPRFWAPLPPTTSAGSGKGE